MRAALKFGKRRAKLETVTYNIGVSYGYKGDPTEIEICFVNRDEDGQATKQIMRSSPNEATEMIEKLLKAVKEANRMYVDHIDGNPYNNDPSNLRVVTALENLK